MAIIEYYKLSTSHRFFLIQLVTIKLYLYKGYLCGNRITARFKIFILCIY